MLSVIVPIYQAVNTLERCVDSIIGQNVDSMEIILIDDGSTDGSSELCDKLSKQNSNIIVKHIANSGPYQARRHGALLSRGEVITFVDADDWIEKDAYHDLTELYSNNNVDILLYAQKVGSDEHENMNMISDGLYESVDIKEKILPSMIWDVKLGCCMIEPSLCSKLIKKELFLEVTSGVNDRLVWGDDAAVTYPMLVRASKIYIYNKSYYHYCLNTKSNTHNYPLSRINELIRFKKVITEKLSQYSDMDFSWQIDCYMRMFIDMLSMGWFGCRRTSQRFIFPFSKIKLGSQVKLYGAGDVGKSYYQVIIQTGCVVLTGWYDKNANEIDAFLGERIYNLDDVSVAADEYILIAVCDYNLSEEIRSDLISRGIPDNKIIWEKPILIS